MADLKISALTASTTPLAGTEVLPIVQSSTTKQVSVANLTAGRAVNMLSATAGNVQVSGNTVTTTDTNGNLTLNPNGSGYTVIVSATNGTIAQMGDTTSRTYYLKSANVGGFDNDTLIFESDSGVGQFQWKNSGATLWTMNRFGNLAPATAGTGIDFAVTSGSGTSELLSDYEEGTWTPTIAAGTGAITSYTTTNCTYTKIGRLVSLFGSFTITNNGTGAGNITISNLPFAVLDTYSAGGVARENALSGTMCDITIDGSTTTLVMRTYSNLYPAATGASFKFSASYIV